MNYKKIVIFWAFLSIVFQIIAPPKVCMASESDVIIITNKNVSETSLKKNEIRNIFLGDKSTWKNGKKINFVLLRKGPVNKSFLDTYINKTSKNFVRYWKRQILTGKAAMPKLVETESEVIDYVAKTEGAVGYVAKDASIGDFKTINIKK